MMSLAPVKLVDSEMPVETVCLPVVVELQSLWTWVEELPRTWRSVVQALQRVRLGQMPGEALCLTQLCPAPAAYWLPG